MSVAGYSELLKEIYGITPESIQSEIDVLLKSKPTPNKMQILKKLALLKKATVSELLCACGMNNTGGSFKAMKKFLDELASLNILKKDYRGRRTYFYFAENSDLKKWLVF